jgi:DHA1 family tetracycline resistance protein-like MFS transporter
MSGTTRRGVLFALLVVFFDMLASAMPIPVLPPLLLQLLGHDPVAAARTAGILGTVFSAMQLLFGPLQGALSDRFGRRPVLIVSCLGLAGAQAVAALAPTWQWLLLGRVLAGVAAANVSTATAYLADILPESERAAGFGRIGIAFGVGLVLGPVVGGILGGFGLRVPFWAGAVVGLFNAGWAAFALTESLPPERRARFRLGRANPVGAMGLLLSDPRLSRLSAAIGLSLLAQQALISVFILSATIRFGWGPHELGLAMGGVGVCYALVGGVLVQPAIRRFGQRATLAAGLVFGIAGFVMLALAPDGRVFVLSIPVVSLWGLAGPVTQGAMSRLVGPDAQGRLQGASTSLAGLAGVVGPSLFGGALAFALRTHGLPGLPFAIAAGLLLAALPVAVRAARD